VDGARTGIRLDESCAKMVAVEQLAEGAPSMAKIITNLSSVTTIGLDLAKHIFQIHGVDVCGRMIVSKALRRKDVLVFFAQVPPCLVGLQACGSAHHWARELIKLGHDVRIMPAAYVKPYGRRQKNDSADAAGICEAVTRPSMRFVGVRTLENQAALMHHKTREMLVAQRTQLINALRGHLAEIGVIAAQGLRNARELAGLIQAEDDETIPACCAGRSTRSCVNCTLWIRRSRAATSDNPTCYLRLVPWQTPWTTSNAGLQMFRSVVQTSFDFRPASAEM
jgi:Transposase